jgi:hypothetical protein
MVVTEPKAKSEPAVIPTAPFSVEQKYRGLKNMYVSDFTCAYMYMKSKGVDPTDFYEWMAKGYPMFPKDAHAGELLLYCLDWHRFFDSDYGIVKATPSECVAWVKCKIPNVLHDHAEGARQVTTGGAGRTFDEFKIGKEMLNFKENFCKYYCDTIGEPEPRGLVWSLTSNMAGQINAR